MSGTDSVFKQMAGWIPDTYKLQPKIQLLPYLAGRRKFNMQIKPLRFFQATAVGTKTSHIKYGNNWWVNSCILTQKCLAVLRRAAMAQRKSTYFMVEGHSQVQPLASLVKGLWAAGCNKQHSLPKTVGSCCQSKATMVSWVDKGSDLANLRRFSFLTTLSAEN